MDEEAQIRLANIYALAQGVTRAAAMAAVSAMSPEKRELILTAHEQFKADVKSIVGAE